jgi:hypothetical protein
MSGNSITDLAAPTAGGDAANKTYVDDQDALKLSLSGGNMSGALGMGTNKITGLGSPENSSDATNLGYVNDGLYNTAQAAFADATAKADAAQAAAEAYADSLAPNYDAAGSAAQALTDATLGSVADRVNFWFVEVHQTDVDKGPWPGNLESNRQQLAELFQRHGYQTESVIHDQLFAWK